MSDFWNQKYQRNDYFYGEQPNDFLRSQIFRLQPGARILVVGDGEGRNGVWLAKQGFNVTTVDFSSVACAKAEELAARAGVPLDVHCADLHVWDWSVNHFDAVVSVYLHFMPEDRVKLHSKMQKALIEGGWLIIELFHPLQLNYQSGGPKAPEMLLTIDELESDFHGLQWQLLMEGKALLTEGPGHAGPAHVTHGAARKPISPQS
ncbi:MAG: class I SAM-dependent methyltransferase [Halothiobacillus sp.]|jgi:SAM-dependent methyltransferase|uniref:SAM-dependent methyltransferase n=1 Tax=Halothiobacillus sp. TaxID=1891311 RepID=UPI002AD56AEE|nr:class I SAM-dependent methyltransferase [Halothiobacillus sp.]MDA3876692.1 class I SAM-dependent methyltransferase [Halothiobacillus sp.]